MKSTWLQVKVQWEDDILQNILFLAITILSPWHSLVFLLLTFFLNYCRGKKCIFTHLHSFQIMSQLCASTATLILALTVPSFLGLTQKLHRIQPECNVPKNCSQEFEIHSFRFIIQSSFEFQAVYLRNLLQNQCSPAVFSSSLWGSLKQGLTKGYLKMK